MMNLDDERSDSMSGLGLSAGNALPSSASLPEFHPSNLPYDTGGLGAAVGGSSGMSCGGADTSSGLLSSGILSSGILCDGGNQSSGLLAGVWRAAHRKPGKPLSICHLGPCMFRGGAEQHLIDLARFLDPQRAVMRECLVTNSEQIDPAVVRSLPCPVRAVTQSEIDAAMQQHDIVLHWGLDVDRMASIGAKRKSVNIYIAHGDSPWTRELLSRSAKHTDHTIAVSHKVVDGWMPPVPATVILNGIDTARLATTRSRSQVRQELGFGCHDFVVGFVGRFSGEKRPELPIEAVSRLPRQFKTVHVGWGKMLGPLLNMANALIPNRYAFRFADGYLGDYYQAFDAFILPSTFEGFGLVILEAMFMGLPVLATPVGVAPEAIESMINGIIVKPCADDIAHKLSLLQSNPDWACGMGAAARKKACEFGHARRMADEYADLFERLVGNRNL